NRSGMRQGFLAAFGGRAGLQGVERREADIGHEMIGRWREARPDHALGLDPGCAHEPRSGVGQMFLAIGAFEFRGVLGDGIENEQMGSHGMFLSWWCLRERDIAGWPIGVGYGIGTAGSGSAC